MIEKLQVLGYPPDDARLHPMRHTDAVFPMTTFCSREQVEKRREELRFQLRMAAGLYPWPEKTPLHTKVEKVGDFDGYSVHKIMFESYPGLWSTGNLYLPRPLLEKAPAILNLIGHWEEQRLTRMDTADYPQQLANFAKMGFVCLVTDMIGKVDSRQLSHEYGGREKELWNSNGLGVQLWNNIRALDLLCSMPEVDENRIGVTGASGGGSQTLFLSLLDDRIKAAAPINMISLHMQGGCPCENAAGLRRHTDNAEMCAMLAPRPLFLAGSTGDWTKYLLTAELPAVLEGYRQYDAEDMVEHFYQDAEHQYNDKTRHQVYRFFARHLMGYDPHWVEQKIDTPDLQSYTWFKGCQKAPGFANDSEFFAFHKTERAAKIAALDDAEKCRMLRWMVDGDGLDGRLIRISKESTDSAQIEKCVLLGSRGEKLPTVILKPKDWDGKRICLALSGKGKSGLSEEMLQQLLDEQTAVVSGDLFLTGEFSDCQVRYAGANYFTTFHNTEDACRVQDVLLLIQAASALGSEVTLYADGIAARAALPALALTDAVHSAKLEMQPLELSDDAEYFGHFYLPGICSIGGLKGCLKLARCDVALF